MDNSSPSFSALSESQQFHLLDKLEVFKVRGRDKLGRKALCVIGKILPARFVSNRVVKRYLEEKIYPELEGRPFAVVYVHTDVQRSGDFPGIATVRSMYESIPVEVKRNLEVVYFVHPDLQARLFLATLGRLLFSGGLYSKLKYVNRLEFLWEHIRRKEIGEMPEFVYDHDKELERCPMIDYGLESDHPRIHRAAGAFPDSVVPSYSMRCIA